MRSRVYATVVRPSVRLSVRLLRVCWRAVGPAGGRHRSIAAAADCRRSSSGGGGSQQHSARRANAGSATLSADVGG